MLYCICLCCLQNLSLYIGLLTIHTFHVKKKMYRKKIGGGILVVNREIDLPAIEFLHIAHIRYSGTSHNHFFCQFHHLEFLNQTIWQDFKLPVCSVVSFLKVLWQAAVGSRLKILHAGRSWEALTHTTHTQLCSTDSVVERSAELLARALNQNIQLWSF